MTEVEKTVYINMGLPGSGKSSWARRQEAYTVSSDDFHYKATGQYEFDIEKAGEAHKYCYRLFCEAIDDGLPHIIVDNTNLKQEHRAPYIAQAQLYSYKVVVSTFHCTLRDAIERNQHRVPPPIIENMYYSMDKPCGVFSDIEVVNYQNGVEFVVPDEYD